MVKDKFKCRVCGLDQSPDLPWGENGDQPSFNICSCCGVEFGYGDDGFENCLAIRQHWVEIGRCGWFSPKERPADWDIAGQIRGIPLAYKGIEDEKLIEACQDIGQPPLRGLAILSAIQKRR